MAPEAWASWALVTYALGAYLMPEPQTKMNVGQLLRTIGFASTPGLLRLFGVIPGVTIPAFAVSVIWMLLATIVAILQALDYESTARAVGVCVLGWTLAIVIAIILGLFFGRRRHLTGLAENSQCPCPTIIPARGCCENAVELSTSATEVLHSQELWCVLG